MDIGEYIEANHAALLAWGKEIADRIQSEHSGLLKVPAQVRVKAASSARAKQLKKGYDNPIEQMTDLVGVRFVVLTSTDLEPIRRSVTTTQAWAAVQARDPDDEIARSPATFGYQSHHYEIRPAVVHGAAEQARPLCCEVQIRTLLQHAYAELTHNQMYKTGHQVPSQAERLVARSMALMETTDELLCRAIEAVKEANSPRDAVLRAASEAVRSLGGASSRTILDEITQTYAGLIDGAAAGSFRRFLAEKPYVLDRVRERAGRGLFEFPDAAALTYWLAAKLEDALLEEWPLPSALPEARQILSDLGVATG